MLTRNKKGDVVMTQEQYRYMIEMLDLATPLIEMGVQASESLAAIKPGKLLSETIRKGYEGRANNGKAALEYIRGRALTIDEAPKRK